MSDTHTAHPRFQVQLKNFEGPFDLLLQLISHHKLDVTEIALHTVTDDFLAHLRDLDEWDLDQATEFLLVAATLLDLKTARLLPSAVVEDEEDLALLEARDLLFARLLQYRAYKRISEWFRERAALAARRYPRSVSLEMRYTEAVPDVILGVSAEQFAHIAREAFTPKDPETVGTEHLHAPQVSVREQAAILRERLAQLGRASFRDLCSECTYTAEIVGRFLATLELYRDGVIDLEQDAPLGELYLHWITDNHAFQESITIDEYGAVEGRGE